MKVNLALVIGVLWYLSARTIASSLALLYLTICEEFYEILYNIIYTFSFYHFQFHGIKNMRKFRKIHELLNLIFV